MMSITVKVDVSRGGDLGIKVGDSVAVSGACLTATAVSRDSFTADLMRETYKVTKFSTIRRGDRVNLERAMTFGGRLDGHIVQGHVDTVGIVKKTRSSMGSMSSDLSSIWVEMADSRLARAIAPKGSVCIDGVSLTVIDASDRSFSVGLIPETLRATSLADLKDCDPVNIEIDVIARYTARLMGIDLSKEDGVESGITLEKLTELGW